MEKYITDERTGLKYELVGDYYLLAGDDEEERQRIGLWGQRHLQYLKQHQKVVYTELSLSGRLIPYLITLNKHAEEMFSLVTEQVAEKENITEALKAENPMLWVQRMNAARETAREAVFNDLIYT